jgi:hypothetical protein
VATSVSIASEGGFVCRFSVPTAPLAHDERYTARLFFGSRRMMKCVTQQGEALNRTRAQRLMRLMGLEAFYPRPRLSGAGRGHRIYQYLTPAAVYAPPGPRAHRLSLPSFFP